MIVFDDRSGSTPREQLERALALITRELTEEPCSAGEAAPVILPSSTDPTNVANLAAKAEAIYKGRRGRDRVFDGLPIFADPAWDILLDLFVAGVRGNRVTVSDATLAACVAPTTGLRWITTLIERDLMRRVADPFDRRRAFLELTKRGFDLTARAIAAA